MTELLDKVLTEMTWEEQRQAIRRNLRGESPPAPTDPKPLPITNDPARWLDYLAGKVRLETLRAAGRVKR